MRHEIRSARFARGLDEEELNAVAEKCTRERAKAGEKLCSTGDVVTKLYVVENGCLSFRGSQDSKEKPGAIINSGGCFGQYSIMINEPMLGDVYAEFDTTLLTIDRRSILELIDRIPRLRENLTGEFRKRLRKFARGEKTPRFARTVAFVRSAAVMPDVIPAVAERLSARGESVVILSDGIGRPRDVEVRPLDLTSGLKNRLPETERQFDRTIVDLAPRSTKEFFAALAACNEVFWAFESASDPSLELLDECLRRSGNESAPTARIRRVCLLAPGEQVAPGYSPDRRLKKRDFIVAAPETGSASRLYEQGVDRIFRHLCDLKIGLALAGGGAKGLAHFGALRAFDRAGISFDMMSGTSAGAMFGLSYAAGFAPDFMIDSYTRELSPPKLVRALPGGDQMYLFWKFRTRNWDKMLRPYFHDWTMDQLQIPFASVAVDLVSGQEVVSDSGDMCRAMLESLNIPGIAKPILRDGMALVDGGVLNNLPAELLSRRHADFVVGVNVGAGLAPRFGDNHPGLKTHEMKMPGNVETFLRIWEVASKGTTELQHSSVDFMIQPELSDASFSDFTKGKDLAEVGEAATEAALEELKAHLDELTRFKRKT